MIVNCINKLCRLSILYSNKQTNIYDHPQQCYHIKRNVNGMKRIEIVEDITILCHIEICKDILHSHAFRNT